MTGIDRLRAFALPGKTLLLATGLVAVAALVLGACRILIGPNTTYAGYIAILLLLPVLRAPTVSSRALGSLSAIAVAALGFAAGSLGWWATLIALALVTFAQGVLAVGNAALLTRAPVNLIACAAAAHAGAELWHVLLGATIGATLMFAAAVFAPLRNRDLAPPGTTRSRLSYAAVAASGAVLIVALAELIDFPYASWALLSYCMILSVGADARATRARDRVLGSVAGAVAATLIAYLPAPFPGIIAVLCVVLCVGYMLAGNYVLYVLFLTPGILLTAASELSTPALGVYRIEAVLAASAIALACNFVLRRATAAREGGSLPLRDASSQREEDRPL